MSELGIRKLDKAALANKDQIEKELVSKRLKTIDDSDTSSEGPDDRLQKMAQAMRTVIEVFSLPNY